MSTDPNNADLPDGVADELVDLVSPELRAEFLKVMERMRARANTPPTEDEHGDPLPCLDMDNPPDVAEDPLLRVGYALLTQLPAHWETVLLQVTAAADEVRTKTIVFAQEDEPRESRFHFFTGLAEPCLALRRSTYEPEGRGAWYNIAIHLLPSGAIKADYDFDDPPFGCWGENEVALVLRDQELYPRDPEQLPHWHPATR